LISDHLHMALKAIRLESGSGLSATFVPEAGMICVSLRSDGRELLGQRGGIEKYVESGKTMGIPILYPWANRLAGDRYVFDGVTVDLEEDTYGVRRDANGLPIHGTLAASPFWEVDETSTGDELESAGLRASLDFGAHLELLEAFPFPHRLEVEITLADSTLTVETTVTPTADLSVPLAFGFHPYISLPDSERDAWAVDLPAMTAIETNDLGIPTGVTSPVAASTEVLGSTAWDRAFGDLPEGSVFGVTDGALMVTVHFDAGYPAAQVFAPPAENVICFEPMKAPANSLATGKGLTSVAPGETDVSRFSINVNTFAEEPETEAAEEPGPFRFQRDAPASEVKRVARERVQSALSNLRGSDPTDRGRVVHETRKDLKKMRAVLRLVRDDLGKENFREENHRYRDAARLLSDVRDADVLEQTIESLRSDFPGDGTTLDALIYELRADSGADDPATGEEHLASAAAAIESAGNLIDSWTLGSDDWTLFENGLRRTYRDGRRGLYRAESDPSVENLHEWRKRVKDLWYQLRLLRNAWSVGLKAQIKETNRLAELLGTNNDLAMLIETLDQRPGGGPDYTDLRLLAEGAQEGLLAEAIPLGHRIYAEDSRQFAERIGTYWTT